MSVWVWERVNACDVCTHVCACVRVPEVTSAHSCPPGSSPSEREGACASRPSVPLPLPVFRFLDCKGSPGACTTVLCTRCQPHPNTPLLRLLPNPRRPNTSLRLSETSTSPTSAYQVGGRSRWGSPHPAVPGGSTPGETHPWPQEHDEEARRGPWDPTAPARVGQCGLGELRKQRGGQQIPDPGSRTGCMKMGPVRVLERPWGRFYTPSHEAERGVVSGSSRCCWPCLRTVRSVRHS